MSRGDRFKAISKDRPSTGVGPTSAVVASWFRPSLPSCSGRLEVFTEERGCFIGDADDFVRCLPIEFETELCPRPTVIPGGEMFEFAAPDWPFRKYLSLDGDRHPRRLAKYAALLSNGFGVSDYTARDQPLASLILTGE
jgi:hypothetical protein